MRDLYSALRYIAVTSKNEDRVALERKIRCLVDDLTPSRSAKRRRTRYVKKILRGAFTVFKAGVNNDNRSYLGAEHQFWEYMRSLSDEQLFHVQQRRDVIYGDKQ